MRLINADTLEQILSDNIRGGYLTRQEIANNKAIIDIIQLIYEQPTVDAEPVKHGNWIVWDEIIAGIYHTVSECSECGFTTDKMSREEMLYCPNCGADMRGEK